MRLKSILVVSYDSLEYNYKQLKKFCPHQECIFMVKADAYGHGLVPIAKFSYDALKIKSFGTASVGEAIKLREILPDRFFEIYIFSEIHLECIDYQKSFREKRLLPIISQERDLQLFLQLSVFKNVPLCLKFNTGMNRLGLNDVEKVSESILKSGRRSIYHLMTHYASTSVESDYNHLQTKRFRSIKDYLEGAGITVERTSLANSAAIEQGQFCKSSHVRPGLLLYGPSALRDHGLWRGKMISSLRSEVLSTFIGRRGMPIGYDQSPLKEEGMIIIIAIGYGDGWGIHSEGVKISIGEYVGEFVGKINMDMSQILLPLKSGKDIKVGDTITLWGESTDKFLQLVHEQRTTPYEVLCSITARIPRVYKDKL